jgi:hypothetical protein
MLAIGKAQNRFALSILVMIFKSKHTHFTFIKVGNNLWRNKKSHMNA